MDGKAALAIDAEFGAFMSRLTALEAAQLEANIIADGCREPLVAWQDLLLDGHHRLEICQRLDLPFSVVEVELEDRQAALLWIVRNQAGRRNLSVYDRVQLALKVEPALKAEAKKRYADGVVNGGRTAGRGRAKGADSSEEISPQSYRKPQSRDELAALAGTSSNTVAKVRVINDSDDEKLKAAVTAGKTSINAAYKKLTTENKRQERTEAILESSQAGAGPNLDTLYPILLVDPPWRYEHQKTPNRAIENQYPTMSLEEICALKIPCTEDAVLYLWATSPKLLEALEVMAAWDFTYRTNAVWVKDRIGPGYWVRQRHELFLIGTRGSFPPPETQHRRDSVIEAPRTKHSEKPVGVYEMIEQAYPTLPKLEMFARTTRKNWAAFGHEAEA